MDVLVTGYPSIDHIARVSHSPAIGETARLLSVPGAVTFGGCGTNTGVGLARLGFEVGAAVVLGDDPFGADYERRLVSQGIDVSNVITLPGQQTSHSYLFLNPHGQYQNFFFPGAADAWQGDLALAGVAAYRYALVTVGPAAYNRQFVAQVHAAGVPLVWSMKPDVVAYPPDVLAAFLDASAYVLMNHIEAIYVLKALDRATVRDLLGETTRAVIITQGERGAAVYTTGDDVVNVPAVPPSDMIDPTGAGDGFAAGFLAGLLMGAAPADSARLGSVVASFVLEAVGCQTNLPDRAAALARYRAYFGLFRGEN